MNRPRIFAASAIILSAGVALGFACSQDSSSRESGSVTGAAPADSVAGGECARVRIDSITDAEAEKERYQHLTDHDFRQVAEELGVEVAAIKAVVEIEAGKAMKGFWAPGVPVVNYDRSMWAKSRRLVTSNRKAPASSKIPAGLPAGHARNEWQQLVNARKINEQQANLSTFWGMFQIGGFNYKLCGCKTIEEFVELMSYSELEQLELFAALITNCGMLPALRAKNWAAFARKYNGPSYARRGYHTRMAAAYRKFVSQK